MPDHPLAVVTERQPASAMEAARTGFDPIVRGEGDVVSGSVQPLYMRRAHALVDVGPRRLVPHDRKLRAELLESKGRGLACGPVRAI